MLSTPLHGKEVLGHIYPGKGLEIHASRVYVVSTYTTAFIVENELKSK